MRKAAAMVGAILASLQYHPNWDDKGSLVSIIIVGGVGGVFLASLLTHVGLFGRGVDRPSA